MRLKYIASIVLSGAMALTSCEDFTDIDQKGMNLMTKTSDLELLLNVQYSLSNNDFNIISGDAINAMSLGYLPQEMSPGAKTYNAILISLDEEAHASRQLQLSNDDGVYTGCYRYIGRICNPILTLVDAAEGPEDHKQRLRAEAYAMRAFFHFIAAQKYARAYNPATADAEMCVPYMTEEADIQTSASQSTQKEVYTSILADCDNAIAIGALPEQATNRMRFCAAMPYAIKAHVLLAMRDIDGARDAALEALRHGNTICDYNNYYINTISLLGTAYDALMLGEATDLEENYFSSSGQLFYNLITPFNDSMYEEGSLMAEFPTYVSMMASMMPAEMVYMQVEQQTGLPYNMCYDVENTYNTLGIKTTHMYLILAECAIEKGLIDDAMGYLDTIRKNRIKTDKYHDLKGSVTTKTEAIECLKKACHGEYVYTPWNFIARKRWTQLNDYKETFTRDICGSTYSLTPESDMWVFPIPNTVTSQNPNLRHNYPTK